jgi:hypothetical protein
VQECPAQVCNTLVHMMAEANTLALTLGQQTHCWPTESSQLSRVVRNLLSPYYKELQCLVPCCTAHSSRTGRLALRWSPSSKHIGMCVLWQRDKEVYVAMGAELSSSVCEVTLLILLLYTMIYIVLNTQGPQSITKLDRCLPDSPGVRAGHLGEGATEWHKI